MGVHWSIVYNSENLGSLNVQQWRTANLSFSTFQRMLKFWQGMICHLLYSMPSGFTGPNFSFEFFKGLPKNKETIYLFFFLKENKIYSVLHLPDGSIGPFYKSKIHFGIFNDFYLAYVWNALLFHHPRNDFITVYQFFPVCCKSLK